MKISPAPEASAAPPPPIEKWLAPKEVSGYFGLSCFSAYRWVSEGIIPEHMVRYCGNWRIRLHPDVIPFLEKRFAANHV